MASKKAKNTKVRNRQAYFMGVIIRVSKKAQENLGQRASSNKKGADAEGDDE